MIEDKLFTSDDKELVDLVNTYLYLSMLTEKYPIPEYPLNIMLTFFGGFSCSVFSKGCTQDCFDLYEGISVEVMSAIGKYLNINNIQDDIYNHLVK